MALSDTSSSFVRAAVSRVITETSQCCSFELELPEPCRAAFTAAHAGQFITLKVGIGEAHYERCYSLSSVARLGEYPRFTVKRLPGGTVSNWCNDQLREGAAIEVAPPLGRFTLRDGDTPLLFAAAGSGITPIYAMLRDALAHTRRRVTLLYVNKTREHAIFARELEALRAAYADRMTLVEIFSDGAGARLDRLLPELLARERGADLYLCGPERFMRAVEQQARAAGVHEDQITLEHFTPEQLSPAAGSLIEAVSGLPVPVTARLGGVEQGFLCAPGQTLLQAGLAAGLGLPSSCREGHCGACMTILVSGTVTSGTTSGLSRRDRQKGYILACQARPTSEEVCISYDVGISNEGK